MTERTDAAAAQPVAIYLIGNLGVGGVVRVLLNLVNHARRVKPVVAVRVAHGGLMRTLDPGIPLYELPSGGYEPVTAMAREAEIQPTPPRPPRGLTPRSLWTFWRECLALRRIVRCTGAVAVVSFLMRGHLIAFVTRLLLVPRLRIIVSLHEHVSETSVEYFPRPIERRLMRLTIRYLFSRFDVVVVPAAPIRDDLIGLGVPSSRVVVRSNPIDLQSIADGAEEGVEDWATPPSGTRLLVGAGRLVAWKAYDVLIRALALLPESPSVHALILGDGPERGALEAIADQLDVRDRVHLPGFRDNPWKYIARADCFVHPSRTEAQGLVFIEAMALGVPVIATGASPGIRASLRDGSLGLLVPPDDPPALAAAITRMLSDADLRAGFVARGRAAAEDHSLAAAVDRFEESVTGSAATR